MAGYPKIWTTLLSEDWFVPLSLNAKGLYLWLIIEAKRQGDTGHVTFTGWSALGHQVNADRATIGRIMRDFQQAKKINVVEISARCKKVEIVNYQKYQSLKKYIPASRGDQMVRKNQQGLITLNPKAITGRANSDENSAGVDRKKHNNSASEKVKGVDGNELKNTNKQNLSQEAEQSLKQSVTRQAEGNVDNSGDGNKSGVVIGSIIESAYSKRFGEKLERKDLNSLLKKYGDEHLLLIMIRHITINNEIKSPVGLLMIARDAPGSHLPDDQYDNWKLEMRNVVSRIK